ncbi:MAG: hypothetical protein EOO41_05265, partial [Methanobacteriota archaeon]
MHTNAGHTYPPRNGGVNVDEVGGGSARRPLLLNPALLLDLDGKRRRLGRISWYCFICNGLPRIVARIHLQAAHVRWLCVGRAQHPEQAGKKQRKSGPEQSEPTGWRCATALQPALIVSVFAPSATIPALEGLTTQQFRRAHDTGAPRREAFTAAAAAAAAAYDARGHTLDVRVAVRQCHARAG